MWQKMGEGEDMQAAFLLLSFGEGRVVILRQGGSAMLNLPTLAFYSSLSLSSMPAFILYFYPNHHFCPIISPA